MRKEIIFAIIAGAIFGLVIAFGIWKANSSMKSSSEITDETSRVEGDDSKPVINGEFSVTLIKPEPNTVITTSPIIVSGATKSNSWLVISAEGDDYIIKTQNDGSFEQEVELTAGVNEIIVTAIDEESAKSVNEKLLVVYSTQFDISSDETKETEDE